MNSELAALYGVTTKRLNQQIRLNMERFPPDFMFQLIADEQRALRLQFETSNAPASGRGGRQYLTWIAPSESATASSADLRNGPVALQD